MNEITIRGAGKRANLQVWRQLVAECRGSGMPVSRWCQENGINVKTYYNWQKKVFEAMVEKQQGGPRFAEVRGQQPESGIAAAIMKALEFLLGEVFLLGVEGHFLDADVLHRAVGAVGEFEKSAGGGQN